MIKLTDEILNGKTTEVWWSGGLYNKPQKFRFCLPSFDSIEKAKIGIIDGKAWFEEKEMWSGKRFSISELFYTYNEAYAIYLNKKIKNSESQIKELNRLKIELDIDLEKKLKELENLKKELELLK